MKVFFCVALTLCCGVLSRSIYAQDGITIRGIVTASDSSEPLVGVVVLDTLSKQYAVSDGYGFFSLGLPLGRACLHFQYVGYENECRCSTYTNGQVLNVALTQSNYLPQIEVTSSSFDQQDGVGTISIPAKTIQLLPQFGGETDVLKTIALMPGVALGVEGTTGLYIRGGSPDQNLVLLDEAPVYNISHFGSFLSVFNADAIKHFDVTKGAWPAQYGGRLSGLVDIHTKEGNMANWRGNATFSPLLGRFLIEGPLQSQKTSLLLSGRSSWFGLLLDLTSSSEVSQRYFMYDFNAKITHHFNARNKLYASYYSSLDDSQVEESIAGGGFGNRERLLSETKTGVKWGNETATLRYASFIKQHWVLQSILYHTRYRFNNFNTERNLFADGEEIFSANANESSNRDLGAKVLLSYSSSDWDFKAGVEIVDQRFQPRSAFVIGNDSSAVLSDAQALQQNYFINADYRPNDWLSIDLGLRYTRHQPSDTTFVFLEPRLRLGARLSSRLRLLLSAHYGQQYLHLLTGGNTGLLNEVWLGSTARVPPQRGGQLALGMSWQSENKVFNVEMEGFYRAMDNLIEFKSVASDDLNGVSAWEDLVETGGEGSVYGMELLFRKQMGSLTGWLGYTWSKSTRQFDSLNRGEQFPFRFDRRHDLSLVILYAFNEKWNVSATWIYQSGSYLTLPTAKIPNFTLEVGGNVLTGGVNINEARNNVRLPAYHRLDISTTYSWKSKKRGTRRNLSLSIYNLYNRINPYYIDTDVEPVFSANGQFLGISEPRVVVVGLFPFIPSLSFSTDFGPR